MKLGSLALLALATACVSAAPAGTAGFRCPDTQTLVFSCFQDIGKTHPKVNDSWTQQVQCGPANGCECVASCSSDKTCLEPITATVVKASNDYTIALTGHIMAQISFKAGPNANPVDPDADGNYPYGGNKDISHIDICLNPSAEQAEPAPEEEIVTPCIKLTKFAGPPEKCGVDMSLYADDVYTLPTSTSDWIYCYQISVPDGEGECIADMTLTDLAPGGIGNMTVVEGKLCPGSTTFVASGINPGSSAPEDAVFAFVDGKGELTGNHVTYDNEAAVAVVDEPAALLTPSVGFVKYAGPDGSCGVDMSLYADDVYTLPSSSSEWVYCYEISIPPGDFECLVGMTVTDVAVGGVGTKVPIEGSLCPGDSVYVVSDVNDASHASEMPVFAVVEGKGEKSGNPVTQEDAASVVGPFEDELPIEEEPRVEDEPPNEGEPVVTSSDCPPVELYAVNGVKVQKGTAGNFGSAANFPITVLSQDTQTVTFELCPDSAVYTGFLENEEYKCFGSDSTSGCETYKADCLTEGKFAVVDLHMLSPVTGDEALVNVPECCIPDRPFSAVYVFVLECVPC